MKEYPKIQGIYKRDMEVKGHPFIEGLYALPELEFLAHNMWVGTEKIHGTNIRIGWIPDNWDRKTFSDETLDSDPQVIIGGKTDKAETPHPLMKRLEELFTLEKFQDLYPETAMTLYGEGCGAGIQKGGGQYVPDGKGTDFILFDILIDNFWLRRKDLEDIAEKLQIKIVPQVFWGNLEAAVEQTKKGMLSRYHGGFMEGMVLKPEVELWDRMGHRVITKVKYCDFHPEVQK